MRLLLGTATFKGEPGLWSGEPLKTSDGKQVTARTHNRIIYSPVTALGRHLTKYVIFSTLHDNTLG